MSRKNFNFNRKKLYVILGVVLVFVMSITIAYAALSSTLEFTGHAEVGGADWDIHLASPVVTTGSVSTVAPTITSDTTATFSVNLTKPGDFYEFNIRVVNDGDIDAVIDTIEKLPDLTEEQAKYIKYEIVYDNGTPINSRQYIVKNSYVKFKVRVEYRKDISASDLPTNQTTLDLAFRVVYVQADIADLSDPDTGTQENNTSVVVTFGRTFNVNSGISFRQSLSEQIVSGMGLSVSTNSVSDMDMSQYFFTSDGRIMNLENTIVEPRKYYESFYLFSTENITNDDLTNETYNTIYADVSEVYKEAGTFYKVPVVAAQTDTYVNVAHAVFPSAYIYGSVKNVAEMEQEIIEEYVLGYPSGQDAGCAGTTSSHMFFGFVDEAGVPIKLETAVNHLDKVKVLFGSVSESSFTYEEAKVIVLQRFMEMVGWS